MVRATEAEIDVVRMNPHDAIDLFRQSVIPALHEQEGYEGCYVLLSEEGKVMVLTFWDSNETARASRLSGFYLQQIEKWMPLMQTDGFAGAKQWCEDNPDAIASGYAPSKEAIILWTHYAALPFAKRNIRVNVISPGPTDTPMMPAFEDHSGKELVDTFTLVAGRRSTPEEQAYPMIFLNSDAASYVTGENLNTDGGMFGGIISGQVDLAALFADFFPEA